jgi:DNA-binding transcriptional regulator YbjK
VSERPRRVSEPLTPNQLDKRRQIVWAAMGVLASSGLDGCTVRDVAAAGPLTKSAIHYYFADMDDLIDRAMGEHISAFEAALREAGIPGDDPGSSFWCTVDRFLETFRDRPNVAHLWFEYWINASRKGRRDAITAMTGKVTAVLAARLSTAGVPAPDDVARRLQIYLSGAIIEQSINPGGVQRIYGDIAELTGLHTPATAATPGTTGRG